MTTGSEPMWGRACTSPNQTSSDFHLVSSWKFSLTSLRHPWETHSTGKNKGESVLTLSIVAWRALTRSVAFLTFLLLPGMGQATSAINPGFDLFTSDAGSFFTFNTVPNPQVVNFEGAPLGSFDFGSGLVSVGSTDTIVQRTQIANLGGGSDTIDIELVALSLISVSPVDVGFGAGFEFLSITLNTSSPSIQSTMTIFDTGEGSPHGTFDSILNLSFDVIGSIGGFYATIESTINSFSNAWQHDPTGIDVIDAVNHLLNGLNQDNDLWPTATGTGPNGNGLFVEEVHPGLGVHKVFIVPVPEPTTALMMGLGLVVLGLGRRRL